MSLPTPIPFFGVAREFKELGPQMLAAIEQVLRSGAVLQGQSVADFERRVAALAGRAHAVACGSCTDALFFALRSLNIGPGDEVLVPAYSFVASASAILRTGATPVFVDIDRHCQLDLERAQDHLTDRTRAILFVQLYGAVGNPDSIEKFAAQHELALIEDFAQSIGARWGNRPAGSLGSVGAVSFDPTKIIGAPGSGGALTIDDPDVAASVRRLRYHGKGQGFEELGYNSQLPSLAAAVLLEKLDHLARYTSRNRALADWYDKQLDDLPVEVLEWPDEVTHARHKFTLHTPERDTLRQALDQAGVETRVHYAAPLHQEPMFAHLGSVDDDYPHACRVACETLSLPIHPYITDAEAEHITESIARFFR